MIEEDVLNDIEAKISEVQKLEPDNYEHIIVQSIGK